MKDTPVRHELVAHVREKIALGHYRGGAVLRATVARMAARGALTELPSRTRAQLLAERQQAAQQGNARAVAEIDAALQQGRTL